MLLLWQFLAILGSEESVQNNPSSWFERFFVFAYGFFVERSHEFILINF